ncbi:MAG TPA: hypothetical protein VK904_00625 [Miltoncostaeaceae bacterium]|nr:hypothetical protein [Miltoncostaeaceae bacterium]
MARALGVELGCPTPAAAMDELAALVPEFAGISHPCLDREGALHWPCPSPARPGRAALYRDRFATPDGRARLADPDLLPPARRRMPTTRSCSRPGAGSSTTTPAR